jgi:hypothetical protein
VWLDKDRLDDCPFRASPSEITMTQKELFAAVRALGLSITVLNGEYRINFRGGREATAYYTNDREDALATAKVGFPDAVGAAHL